jgi:hypothetical protein
MISIDSPIALAMDGDLKLIEEVENMRGLENLQTKEKNVSLLNYDHLKIG